MDAKDPAAASRQLGYYEGLPLEYKHTYYVLTN